MVQQMSSSDLGNYPFLLLSEKTKWKFLKSLRKVPSLFLFLIEGGGQSYRYNNYIRFNKGVGVPLKAA